MEQSKLEKLLKGKKKGPSSPSGAEGRIDPLQPLEKILSGTQKYLEAQVQPDGHWCAELESNVTISAEYVFMAQMLGLDLDDRREGLIQYFLSHQKPDGSWGIAFNYRGDISTTAETYLALRILGVKQDNGPLKKAERYIRGHGGLESIRVFTRIWFAMFGLFPWKHIPIIPPEFILMPSKVPMNIYALSSWARGTMVPLFIIFHHKPVFALPNGKMEKNPFLDHLWLDPTYKKIPYVHSWFDLFSVRSMNLKSVFLATNEMLRVYEKVKPGRLRNAAVKKCEDWVLQHQEESGDWAGIFPPMVNGVIALHLQGYSLDSDPVRKGIEAIHRFALNDHEGYRVQACVSPVWDTILSAIALIDTGYPKDSQNVEKAFGWLMDRQITVDYGDWKVYNPKGTPGSWAFEYVNTWYPDVDDTAAVVIGLLKFASERIDTPEVQNTLEWLLSMQNSDGGWGAFDLNNDREFLNEIPFSDMDSLVDPSTPDIAGRLLEALGVASRHSPAIDAKTAEPRKRAIEYLRRTQEPEGSWFGRWGVNYVYGTSNVLCGLVNNGVASTDPMVQKALQWMQDVQNEDGGWGECLESYFDRKLMGHGESCASQTAWGLMALLNYLPPENIAIQRGVRWLEKNAVEILPGQFTWNEKQFTGTGFPNHFYLRYHFYRHYFPMMALGRYHQKMKKKLAN